MSKLQIDWAEMAEEAAEVISCNSNYRDIHRETMLWHGPTDTWVAFDTHPGTNPGSVLDQLEELFESEGIDVRATDCSDGESDDESGGESVIVLLCAKPCG